MEIPPDLDVSVKPDYKLCPGECPHWSLKSGMDDFHGCYEFCWFCPDCGYLGTCPPEVYHASDP